MAFISCVPSIDLSANFFDARKFIPQPSSPTESDCEIYENITCKLINNKPPLTPLTSILHDSNTVSHKSPRKDFYGTKIRNNLKSHKVTFRDIIPQQSVEDVISIVSFKDYNKLDCTENGGKMIKGGGCSCAIF